MDLKLLPDFITETTEHLEEMDAGLLTLEKDRSDKAALDNVFRTAHSIKGNAEYIGIAGMAALSHNLENLLEILRKNPERLRDSLFEILFRVKDRLDRLLSELAKDQKESSPTQDILEALDTALSIAGGEPETDQATKASLTAELKQLLVEMARSDVREAERVRITEILSVLKTDPETDPKTRSVYEQMEEKSVNILFSDDAGDILAELNRVLDEIPRKATDEAIEETAPTTYDDETDEELYTIFIQHLQENLTVIETVRNGLLRTDDHSPLLEQFNEILESLKSSANYMDYRELVRLYERWTAELEVFREDLFLSENPEFQVFLNENIGSYINEVVRFFPQSSSGLSKFTENQENQPSGTAGSRDQAPPEKPEYETLPDPPDEVEEADDVDLNDDPEPRSAEPGRSVSQSIRVDSGKIDALMNQAGELVVSRAGFAQLLHDMIAFQHEMIETGALQSKDSKSLKDLIFKLNESILSLGRVANELQDSVMKVRMLPISRLFNRYPRLVRDLVHESGKAVRLDISGEETELDKMVIEAIADPVVHIIRNAIDHGIETVSERVESGKPETAVLKLDAYHESNHVVIEILDDGRGIDPDRIKLAAQNNFGMTAEEMDKMGRKELISLITIPGFSTSETITTTSGRGVGMDVVKSNIEKLNGTLEIDSIKGQGTRIRIKIPLTLAIIKALLVKTGADTFTIPLAAVEETLQIFESEISMIDDVEVFRLRDKVLPLLRLSDILNIEPNRHENGTVFIVVVNTGSRQTGLVVDRLLGQEETVIKPLVDYLQENSGFSGATILGDGSISLILDIYELVNLSVKQKTERKKGRKPDEGQSRTIH